jgi:hypothetical protein
VDSCPTKNIRLTAPGCNRPPDMKRVAQSSCGSNSAALYLINIHFLLMHRDDVHGSNPGKSRRVSRQRLCATTRRPSVSLARAVRDSSQRRTGRTKPCGASATSRGIICPISRVRAAESQQQRLRSTALEAIPVPSRKLVIAYHSPGSIAQPDLQASSWEGLTFRNVGLFSKKVI